MIISVIITCHNRRTATLACLDALYRNNLPAGAVLDVVLVDDGSTDGTSSAVAEQYSEVTILRGDGDLYWNRGMHMGLEYAMRSGLSDFYLWLNDDTFLKSTAIADAIGLLESEGGKILVVGAICDPVSGESSYGGGRFVNKRLRPFLYRPVLPDGRGAEVDVVNGNFLLIPSEIAIALGNLDPVFEHSMGDIDYSMRARKLGFRIVLTANFVGTCSRNSNAGTHRDNSLPLNERIRHVFSRKGLPWKSWLTMCRRHGGGVWPIHFLWGYIKVIAGRG